MHSPSPEPDIPPLKPCPFCRRPASVTPHQDIPTTPVRYSIGCWHDADPFSREAHFEDCPGPTTLWVSLEGAVAQWNKRARGGQG